MKTKEILTLFDAQERRNVIYPDLQRDVCLTLVRYVGTASNPSFVLYSDLNKSSADAAIQEQIEFFSQQQQSFEWKVYDYDKPHDLLKRLMDYGLELEDTDAVMALDLQDALPDLLTPPTVDVRQITDSEDWKMSGRWRNRCGVGISPGFRSGWALICRSQVFSASMWLMLMIYPPARDGPTSTPTAILPDCGVVPPWSSIAVKGCTRRCSPHVCRKRSNEDGVFSPLTQAP